MKLKKLLVSFTASVIFAFSTISAVNVSAVTDPDGDGSVTLYDAILITRYLSGNVCPTNISALDYDGNGIISQMDAYKVSMAIIGG